MVTYVEIREEDGGYTAIDPETGTRGSGETRAIELDGSLHRDCTEGPNLIHDQNTSR